MKLSVSLCRFVFLAVLLIASPLVSASAAEGPTEEETLRFIEKLSLEARTSNTPQLEYKWEIDKTGKLINHSISDLSDFKMYHRITYDMSKVDFIRIVGYRPCTADIKKCYQKTPSLGLYCKDNAECIIHTSSQVSYDDTNRETSILKANSFAGAMNDGGSGKEALYKLKNALQHLFELHGHSIGFKDEFYIDEDLFSGAK